MEIRPHSPYFTCSGQPVSDTLVLVSEPSLAPKILVISIRLLSSSSVFPYPSSYLENTDCGLANSCSFMPQILYYSLSTRTKRHLRISASVPLQYVLLGINQYKIMQAFRCTFSISWAPNKITARTKDFPIDPYLHALLLKARWPPLPWQTVLNFLIGHYLGRRMKLIVDASKVSTWIVGCLVESGIELNNEGPVRRHTMTTFRANKEYYNLKPLPWQRCKAEG